MQTLLRGDVAAGAPATVQEQSRLTRWLRHLDFARRIDLSKEALPLSNSGWPQRALRLFVSDGMVDTGKIAPSAWGQSPPQHPAYFCTAPQHLFFAAA
jgi:hypothetical protein